MKLKILLKMSERGLILTRYVTSIWQHGANKNPVASTHASVHLIAFSRSKELTHCKWNKDHVGLLKKHSYWRLLLLYHETEQELSLDFRHCQLLHLKKKTCKKHFISSPLNLFYESMKLNAMGLIRNKFWLQHMAM